MKKNQTVQGTFSKLFGKKHANPPSTSLYATNPPWIFTQEAPEEGSRDFGAIYYGDNRFDSVSESGTATLKARPRVRPLLTFLPLNAQENHGLAVPTPSVPGEFADKEVTGTSSLVNGNLRLYSSVGDLRPGHYGQDPLIPPPPPGPAPGPPTDALQPREESPPPPPSMAPPPPPLLLEPPPPPSTAPPPPPVLGASAPLSTLSSPSTPTPPDFIPPAPPLASLAPPPPPLPAPAPPASPHTTGPRLFAPGGVTKWKSEVALNGRQPETPRTSPPQSPAEPKGSLLGPKPDPHLTFPRSFKVPPPTPVRTSSIPAQEAQATPVEEGATKKAPHRLPLPPSFHIRPASQVYADRTPEPDHSGELRTAAPASPGLGQAQSWTKERAETLPPAPPLPSPAPPQPPPAPPLPPAAPPLPSAEKAVPQPSGFGKSRPTSSPAPKPKLNPPSPEDAASSAPVDWRDPSQMEKLRSELAAYLCGSKREDRVLSHWAGPTVVASQEKEGKKGPSPPEKEIFPSVPEKSPCSLPVKGAATSLTLPPVDYTPQESPAPSVRQICNELEARFSSSAEKEAKPSIGSVPPKPQLEGGRSFENRGTNGNFSKPVAKNLPPLSTTPLPTTPLQSKATPGPATPPKATPGPATPPKTTPGPATSPKTTPGPATSPKTTPGPATSPKATPGPATPGPATPPKAMPGPATSPKATPTNATPGPALPPKPGPGAAIPSAAPPVPTTSPQSTENLVPAGQWEKPRPRELTVPGQLEAEGRPTEPSKPPTPGALSAPAFPPKRASGGEETTFLYKLHPTQKSPSHEVAMGMAPLATGSAHRSGEPEEKEPQGQPAKPPTSAQPVDELLRHPVTGEVVQPGSPMALLLAARQRAQKGRPGGLALSRSSLPGSLRGHSSQPQAGSDSIFHNEGRPNSFTVVPKLPKEAEKDTQLASLAQATIPSQWKPQPRRDPEGTAPSLRHNGTKAEPHAPVAWERPASSNLPQGRVLPKSFSSPPSPSCKDDDDDDEVGEFHFEVIPPPPEFSNDPEPPAPAFQYLGRRGSPPRNNFSNLGQPSAPRGFSRFPAGAHHAGAEGLERFSGGGRSLIKKRLYVGEPHRSPGQPHGGTGRSLSSPNCFGPPPGGPEMRRVNSAGRALPGGLHARRLSMEGAARGEAKFKTPGGDYGFAPATSRSPHSTPHYGSPINTFTVRPGTRHPISYAYSGNHRQAPS
ncbi:uncharacterized protein C6orf132 homolog [Meles meles]|uniref:uncharacterized protein C6orf132 homolog n=1 Tax=Meles meles TaxID=9662 RepID=UPI001E699AD9|nr:uncharacterized protein C6orf132 homolog [Meles meles]